MSADRLSFNGYLKMQGIINIEVELRFASLPSQIAERNLERAEEGLENEPKIGFTPTDIWVERFEGEGVLMNFSVRAAAMPPQQPVRYPFQPQSG